MEGLLLNATVGLVASYATVVGLIVWNFWIAPGEFYGKRPWLFAILKSLLLPLCSALYIQNTSSINGYVLAQEALAWIGDIAFLSPVNPFPYIGGFSFGFSHLVLPLSYGIRWMEIPRWVYVTMVATVSGHLTVVVPKLDLSSHRSIIAIGYIVVLELGLFFALARITILPFLSLHYLASVVGYCFFIFSDNIVIHAETVDKNIGRRIEVMSTYSIAQFLLMIGNTFTPHSRKVLV